MFELQTIKPGAASILMLLCSHAIAVLAEPFVLKAGNGMPILSPIDKSTVQAKDGTHTLQIPAGMACIPGKFNFGESETRDLPAYAMATGDSPRRQHL